MKHTRLRRYTTLRKGGRLRPISQRQQERNDNWRAVVIDRITRLNNLCEWCGLWGSKTHYFNPLDGHHIRKRRYHDDSEPNCFVCHRLCHDIIGAGNIKVYRGMEGVWAEGDEREKILDKEG